jgi:type I restriction enzyme M protein
VSSLGNFVWGVADLLRGPYRPNQYGEVILPMTILRRLECVMEPHREAMAKVMAEYEAEAPRRTHVRRATGLTFYNSSAYTMATALEDPDNLAANLVNYINGFSSEIDIFKHFEFEAQIRNLDTVERLAPVVREFAKIDLHPDAVGNADMGDLFEHLIYRDFESANAEAGDFYTPRDAIRLLVDMLFANDTEALRSRNITRSVYDPTAGTGGMLSVSEEHLLSMNKTAKLALYAQEVNATSYAVCKSDLLIKGQVVENVRLGDTLVNDMFAGDTFDYCLSNPPYGVDWKASERSVRAEHARGEKGRFGPGLPAVGDGAMLFLLHLVAKMRPVDRHGKGGRAGIVLSGSPLFNGGADSGPSNIRGHLLENDLLEAIVALPNDMFYNTGIATYLWILDNAKSPERRGKVQLIDATGAGTKMRKSLGAKRLEISETDRETIVQSYAEFAETAMSKIFDNLDFASWSVTIERPLRLRFACTAERVDTLMTAKEALSHVDGLREALDAFSEAIYLSRDKFLLDLGMHFGARNVHLTPAQFKALWQGIGVRDESADICVSQSGKDKGKPEPDTTLRDTEQVPFGWGGHAKSHDAQRETIDAYFVAEVAPYVPDAWVDHSKTKAGYEIPLTRHFYTFTPPRPLEAIDADLNRLAGEIIELLKEVEK